MENYSVRRADRVSLEKLWNKNIALHAGDPSWQRCKDEFIGYNERGEGVSFILFWRDEPVGEITLLTSSKCRPIAGRTFLADGRKISNINALRIDEDHRGKGLATRLISAAEQFARENGFEKINLGVEAKEAKNVAIYLHLGYTEFIYHEIYDGSLILYYSKDL